MFEKLLVGTTWDEWQKEMSSLQIGSKVLVYDYTDDKCEFIGPFVVSDVRNGAPIDKYAWNGKYPSQAKIESAGDQKVIRLNQIGTVGQQMRLMRKKSSISNVTMMPVPIVKGEDAKNLDNLFQFSQMIEKARSTTRIRIETMPQPPKPPPPPVPPSPPKPPQGFKTKQGFNVSSKAERLIANYLAELQIECYYDGDMPGGSGYRYDFYLPKSDVYIEYWGLEGNAEYERKREIKRGVYRQFGYRLIELSPKDEYDLEDRIRRDLRGYGVLVEPTPKEPVTWLERFFRWLKSLFT